MPKLPSSSKPACPVRRDSNYLRHYGRYMEEVLDKYKDELAYAFAGSVGKHELEIRREPELYPPAPYDAKNSGSVIMLREHLFKFGTSEYCIVYDFSNGIVTLLGMCYARTNRNMGFMRRVWAPRGSAS